MIALVKQQIAMVPWQLTLILFPWLHQVAPPAVEEAAAKVVAVQAENKPYTTNFKTLQ